MFAERVQVILEPTWSFRGNEVQLWRREAISPVLIFLCESAVFPTIYGPLSPPCYLPFYTPCCL